MVFINIFNYLCEINFTFIATQSKDNDTPVKLNVAR